MDKFTIGVGFLLTLQLLLRGFRLKTLPVPRLVLSVVLLGLAYWMQSVGMFVAVGILASWFVSSELGGMVDPLRDVRKGLSIPDPARVAVAIQEAQNIGTDKAQAMLLDHLVTQARNDDRKSILVVMHALVEKWGVDEFLLRWEVLPDAAREKCLEALMGKTGFPTNASLKIARRGMDDAENVAAAGWRTYASIVAAGFEQEQTGFDAQAWLRESADDKHPEVQGLRAHLEQKRVVELQAQGVDALVSRYRREFFIHPSPAVVKLRVEADCELETEGPESCTLPAGAYTGTLSGKFDNAQNAVAEGWRFHLKLEDVNGATWNLTTVWHSAEFFGEILNERHAPTRTWFDDAPPETDRALATNAFVGPVVAYGDAWDACNPTIGDEALAVADQQLLKCLIAIAPEPESGDTELCFLLYGVEDAENEGDWLQPFVTTIPLERMLLSAGLDDTIELPTVEIAPA